MNDTTSLQKVPQDNVQSTRGESPLEKKVESESRTWTKVVKYSVALTIISCVAYFILPFIPLFASLTYVLPKLTILIVASASGYILCKACTSELIIEKKKNPRIDEPISDDELKDEEVEVEETFAVLEEDDEKPSPTPYRFNKK